MLLENLNQIPKLREFHLQEHQQNMVFSDVCTQIVGTLRSVKTLKYIQFFLIRPCSDYAGEIWERSFDNFYS